MATLLINPVGLTEVLHAPGGPVARDVTRRTIRVHGVARELCPVNTGRLRSSIRFRFVSLGGEFCGAVGTDVEYAIFVERGTRPHVITPKRAKVLRFEPHGSAQAVFARSVNHPGTRARPFLLNALTAAGE